MSRWLLGCWVLLSLLPGPAHAARLLLSVGHDRGAPDQAVLRWSESEAVEFASVMTELGGVDPEDAWVLQGPTRAEFLEALGAVRERVLLSDERTEVLLYVSGHARDGALSLGGEALPLDELREALERVPADVVVAVTDACTSATVLRSKGIATTSNYQMEIQSLEGPSGRVWITSAGPSEPAYESDHAGGSLFARNLFAALRGAADADRDGTVTLAEAYSYLYSSTLADALDQAGTPQHAHMETSMMGAAELVWTSQRPEGASLLVGEALDGAEIWVVDAQRGRAVLEVASAQPNASLSLYPGSFTIYVRQDGKARVSSVQLGKGQRHTLMGEGRLASLRPIRTRGGGVLPGRWELSGVLNVRSGTGKGTASLLGGGVRIEGQLTRFLRVGGAVAAAGGRFTAQQTRVRQVEVGGEAGGWFSPAGIVQPFVGGKLGLFGTTQTPEPGDPPWYSIGASHGETRSALAPAALGEAGLLFRMGTRVVSRLSVDAGLFVYPGIERPDPRFRWGLGLSVGGVL